MPTGDHTSRAERDYSATPLATKLGVRKGSRLYVIGAPEGFSSLLDPLPGGVQVLRRLGRDLDVIVLFSTKRRPVKERFAKLASALSPAGRLWIAWPKKASKVPTDLTFDEVQRIGLDAGLVDNKSASITDVYQGLQFVYRLRDRRR
jgi:hypothetical protein